MNALSHLNDQVFLAINGFARHTPWLHAPVQAYAKYGAGLFGLLLVLGLLSVRRGPTRSLAASGWACVAVLVALAVNQPIGRLVAEPRPYAIHHGILVLAQRTSDFSFPSDHAVMAGATATGLLLFSRRLGLIAAAAAVLMAFARVYIAAHYPWDVLAGLALGGMLTWAIWELLDGPITAFAGWLRDRPGVNTIFAPTPEPEGAPAA